jgi:transposase
MSKSYRPYDPDQMMLMPPSIKEWLPAEHLAHFVSDVVENLDLTGITSVYEREERGYPPYHPVMMTKVLVYGYCVGVSSSRRIARACIEDVAFRVLAANNAPDFRTISDFRKRHLEALKNLFVEVLRLCREAGLITLGHVALDGTKMKANASKHKAMSYGRMVEEEKRLAAEVERFFREAEETDKREDALYGAYGRGIFQRGHCGVDIWARVRTAHPAGQAQAWTAAASGAARPDPSRIVDDRSHAPQAQDETGKGDLRQTQGNCGTGVWADQAGPWIQAILVAGAGEGAGGVVADLHGPQPTQALARRGRGSTGEECCARLKTKRERRSTGRFRPAAALRSPHIASAMLGSRALPRLEIARPNRTLLLGRTPDMKEPVKPLVVFVHRVLRSVPGEP